MSGKTETQPVKMIYRDNKQEVEFKSLTHACRVTGYKIESIKNGLSPLKKRVYKFSGRDVVFRIIK